jgi:hypothetical protein
MRVSSAARRRYYLPWDVIARLRCYLPEDFNSRLLIGTIAFVGSAVLIVSLLAPAFFPAAFRSSNMTAMDLVPYLLPW